MKRLNQFHLSFFIAAVTISHAANMAFALPYIGEGCTTALWIDKDCDGYVIGGKDGKAGVVTPTPPAPPYFEPDANDLDPNVNTPQSVFQKYGDFSNLGNLKAYLVDLGYTHQINNVYFVSVTGNDATGQPNNINFPYRHYPQPLMANSAPIIVAGDVIVFRGGVYPEALGTEGRKTYVTGVGTQHEGFQGTAAQPVLMINFPGERVIFLGNGYSCFGWTEKTKHTITDGFEFDGESTPGQFVREIISVGATPIDYVTLKNSEARNSNKWGIFGYQQAGRDHVTFDNVVVHHIHGEHTLYRNDAISGPDTDDGWVIRGCIFYFCQRHAIHWRGGKNFLFENNIFHTTGMMGIEIKNDAENGIIRNNLIFNAERAPISIWDSADQHHTGGNGNQNLFFYNNIFAAKAGTNGFGGDNTNYAAVRLSHSDPNWKTHKNIQFFNNVFFTKTKPNFYIEAYQDIPEVRIENNIFYRSSPGAAPNDEAGMYVCGWTDGTHSVGPKNETYCPQMYYWNFDAMQDPVNRPNIANNLHGDPKFTDVNNAYTAAMTPWLYDYTPNATSPSIDFALNQYAPAADLKGKPRIGPPDAGAYEYSSASSNQSPFVNAGLDQAVVLPGSAQLAGNVVDDGLPNPPGQAIIQWTKMSGPGAVGFSNPNNAATNATFSAAGIYVLRLTANDGALFASDQVLITVSDPNGPSNQGGSSNYETKFTPCMDLKNPSHMSAPPICYELKQSGHVELIIYAMDGKEIRKLLDADQPIGPNTVFWDRKNEKGEIVGSGVYVTVLKFEDEIKKGKVVVFK